MNSSPEDPKHPNKRDMQIYLERYDIYLTPVMRTEYTESSTQSMEMVTNSSGEAIEKVNVGDDCMH